MSSLSVELRIKPPMTVTPLGDSAIVISIGETLEPATTSRVRAVAAEIERRAIPGVLDVVPAFGRIAVFFDPAQAASFEALRVEFEAIATGAQPTTQSAPPRLVEIPVCYGGEHGPDLELIAAKIQKSPGDVAALHAGADYQVHAIGFAPGFPYLGGLPPELATPRRDTPRPRVPAGSIGIGGMQTGIYPLETPGGWNIIGRTPLRLFDVERAEPSLLRTGDQVKFRSVTSAEFETLSADAGSSDRVGPSATATAQNPEEHHSNHSREYASRAHTKRVSGVEVLRAGMFTTVQDLGRRGHRAEGVPLSGGADIFALRVANLLVGNHEREAVLEFTLVGPELKFLHDTVIAIGGAEFGKLPRWRPIAVRAGATVKIGPARNGCRGYLAIAGGIDVAPVLGSRSTYVRGRLGGHEGRRLLNGDMLAVPEVRRTFRDHWRIDERILPRYSALAIVRVVPGEHLDQFDPAWMSAVFKVSTQSDRMGVRMIGEPLQRRVAGDLPSSPVAPGTVQVPPDGRPIVLLADAQIIGGYPQVAHVISVDLPVVSQLRPGDEVRFIQVSMADARELIAAQERAIGLLREGLAQKLA
jgi:KipI family sensor histidine kinase inhibitor